MFDLALKFLQLSGPPVEWLTTTLDENQQIGGKK